MAGNSDRQSRNLTFGTRRPGKLVATAAVILFLYAVSTTLECANAFAIPAQRGHRLPSTKTDTTTFLGRPDELRSTSIIGGRGGGGLPGSSSSSSLAAVAAAPSLAGAVLATIGNALFPRSASALSKALRVTALFVAGAMVVSTRLRQRAFWPGMTYPENPRSELLPGFNGCPLIGCPWIYTSASKSYGVGSYYRKISKALGATLGKVPRVWRYYMLGKPGAVVSGGKTFQKVLGMEFDGPLTSSGKELLEGDLMPSESLLYERDKKRHSYLRRLVGAALTPAAVAKTAPTLQAAAEEQVARMMVGAASGGGEEGDGSSLVTFQKICTDYTLDVAWRQILGLELTEEEIPVFEGKVETWIEGITSLRALLRYKVKSTPGYAARLYLIGKINEKIDQLLEKGPDETSTLSAMVFATDEEDPTKKLSRDEVIDNALILIFAGSETSASTLTNAMLFLGLHPGVWEKVVREQETIREAHGDALTISNLDANNAPYLDAVLKETMRMRTIAGGIPRTALEDIDVDGDGKTIIPKGYFIDPSFLLTHEEDPGTKLPGAMHLDAIQGFRPERWLPGGTENPPARDWYVPYGFGPRYCLGRNLAQLEMKVFLATMARRLDFPRLSMLPAGYDYSPTKKDPSDPNYFSVEWSTTGTVIPMAGDGVLASVSRAKHAAAAAAEGDSQNVDTL